jgi:glycosyltransferase involved in cell wall biosynthesis
MSDTQSIPLSVIIPVYNDPEGLETTVESLLNQTVDDYEILIADNGSTDLTRKLAKAYATRDRIIHVVEDEIQGSYAARNAGIAAARGEILCFIDANMWVDSTWLERVQERIRSDEADYLGCNVEIVVDEETIFAEYNRENGFPVETYIAEENFAPTCCLVVRRSVIDAVGPFDKRLVSSGDAEFGKRVHRAGYEQAFAGDITMYHPARSSLLSLLQKQSRIGRGQVQRATYHPEPFGLKRHPVHPFNFLPVPPTVLPELCTDRLLYRCAFMYGISCLEKFASTLGKMAEWMRQIRADSGA